MIFDTDPQYPILENMMKVIKQRKIKGYVDKCARSNVAKSTRRIFLTT